MAAQRAGDRDRGQDKHRGRSLPLLKPAAHPHEQRQEQE